MSSTRNRVSGQVGPKKASESNRTHLAGKSVEDTFQPKEDPGALKKLTIQIDVDLHRRLKAIAAQEGKTMREIVEEQLTVYVTSKK